MLRLDFESKHKLALIHNVQFDVEAITKSRSKNMKVNSYILNSLRHSYSNCMLRHAQSFHEKIYV
jgi:hypothetical protein